MGKKDYNHLPEWLPPRIRATGLTVEQFANEVEISRAMMYFYLIGRYRPSTQAMARICRKLDVPLEEGLRQYMPLRPGPKGGKK